MPQIEVKVEIPTEPKVNKIKTKKLPKPIHVEEHPKPEIKKVKYEFSQFKPEKSASLLSHKIALFPVGCAFSILMLLFSLIF